MYGLGKIGDFSDRTVEFDIFAVMERDSRGVVSSVFKFLESVYDIVIGMVIASGISKNTAHVGD